MRHLLAAVATAALPSVGLAVQTYLITDLGAFDSGTSSAAAINANAQCVGTSTVGSVGFDGFSFLGGTLRDLGNLGGDSSATALNSRGDIVGESTLVATSVANHPFLFRNGALLDLGLPAGFNTGGATGVNDSDQVVGQLISGPRRHTVSHAFLWQNGAYADLGSLGGGSASASAISRLGQVVGSSTTASGESHAFLWQNGVMGDLGVLPGGSFSSAAAINDAGQVVGSAGTANFGPSHAVVFQDGAITDLGLPSGFTTSTANAINNHGTIVGVAAAGSYGDRSRALVVQNGLMLDLNRLIPGNAGNWILQSATGINDSGAIVGTGTHDGAQRAFLLTPATTPTVPAVPIGGLANSGNAVVTLTWLESFGAASYRVKRATSAAGPFTTIATVATTSFTDRAVLNCTVYSYVISAVNTAGESPNSSAIAGVPQSIPPAPSGLTTKPNTQPNLFIGSALDVSWHNNAGSCAEFVVVERSTDGVNFNALVTLGTLQNTYTDGFLNSHTRYYYRVRSQSNGGASGPSNVASAVAP